MDGRWEHFPHVGDVGIRGFGRDWPEAFEQAALALTAVVCDPASVRPLTPVRVSCVAADRELLLLEWLNAVIYEMDVRNMVFSRFEVRPGVEGAGLSLVGLLVGEALDVPRHQPSVLPKAATAGELQVGERAASGGREWYAQCVIDV